MSPETILRRWPYAVADRRNPALRLLRELEQLSKRKQFVSAFSLALVHAGLGEKDEASHWLAKAHDAIPFIKTNPRLATLRTDTRFTGSVPEVINSDNLVECGQRRSPQLTEG